MIDQLSALRLFVRVARSGSFSRAAREHNITQPTVSRTIAALEAEIGAALFTRTTRALTLTEAGADYLERVETLIDALDEANHAVRGSGELRGVLRVGLSSSMAVRAVIPLLPQFAEAHPALRIELIVNDKRQDLIVEGIDIALRFGAMSDSTAVARPLATWPRIIAAAPSYLARMGVPATPADLARHSAILSHSGIGAGWTFAKDGQQVTVRVDGQIMSTSHDGTFAAAVAGMGIIWATRPACREELASGALVRLLPDWDMPPLPLSAVFAGGRAAKPAARALADFLARQLPLLQ